MRFEQLFETSLRNGLSKPKKVRGIGYPMINMGEIFSHDIIYDIPMDLVPMTEKEKENSYLKKYDLLFARQSLTLAGAGKCSIFLGNNVETTFESHLIRVRLDKKKCNPLFYYYYFQSLIGKSNISGIVEQVSAAGIRGSDLKRLEVPMPNILIQNKIVDIMYKIDSKIELNNQMIATLEELAATLFKRWFVDFEFPDENGNPYKSSGGKMVDSELGEIPEGWEVKSLTQIAVYKNGLAMQKFRPTDMDNSLPVLKIKELNQGFVDSSSDRCSIDIKDDVKVFNGDVIFSWSGTLLVKLWTGGNAGLNQHLFKVTSDQYGKWFYFLWTKHYLNQFVEIAKDKATTMGHIKRENLNNSKVCYPTTDELWKMFSGTFSGLIDKLIELGLENNSLKKTRDSLLPKLLLGELSL
jgi:type I restriction enzyme S subunit